MIWIPSIAYWTNIPQQYSPRYSHCQGLATRHMYPQLVVTGVCPTAAWCGGAGHASRQDPYSLHLCNLLLSGVPNVVVMTFVTIVKQYSWWCTPNFTISSQISPGSKYQIAKSCCPLLWLVTCVLTMDPSAASHECWISLLLLRAWTLEVEITLQLINWIKLNY